MSYKRKLTMKVIRMEHEVILCEGESAKTMRDDLSHVPDRSVLKEFHAHESDPTMIILRFLEETVADEPL